MFAYSVATGTPEDGFGVVTDRFLCLLGPEATAAVARDVYRLLDDQEASTSALLDLLTIEFGLVRFAVVELLDPVARSFAIAVRGKVALEIEQASATRLSGASDAAWISTEARGVNTLRLMLDGDATAGEQLPVRRGVVVTTFVSLDDPSAATEPAPSADEEALKTRPIVRPKLETAAPVLKKPVAKKKPSAKPKPVALELPAEVEPGDSWVLTLPDGSEVDVRLPIVVGRRPWTVDAEGREVVHVVAPPTRHEISGTHLELFLADGAVQARDLNSTNGTVVRTQSRAPRLLHSGGTTALVAGDILDIGEDFSIALNARD